MKKQLSKYLSFLILSLTLMLTLPSQVEAQCPMCRMSAESNLKDGGTAGKGLNMGILYMLATPYLIVGTVGLVWWYNRRKEDERAEEATL